MTNFTGKSAVAASKAFARTQLNEGMTIKLDITNTPAGYAYEGTDDISCEFVAAASEGQTGMDPAFTIEKVAKDLEAEGYDVTRGKKNLWLTQKLQ